MIVSNNTAPKQASTQTIESTTVTITPTEAKRILERENYAKQRPYSAPYAHLFAEIMKRQEWLPGSQLQVAQLPNGRRFFLNGQHRLGAGIESNTSQVFTLTTIFAQNEDEVFQHYMNIDRGRKRSLDLLVPELAQTILNGDTSTNGKQFIRALVSAGPMIALHFTHVGGSHYTAASADFRQRMAYAWSNEAKLLWNAIKDGDKRLLQRMLRTVPLSLALLTFRFQPEKAEEFWSSVAKDDGLRAGDPRKALVDFFREDAKRYNQAQYTKVNRQARAIAGVWNSWLAGETQNRLRAENRNLPLVLDGTPYRSRKNFAPNIDLKVLGLTDDDVEAAS